MKSLNPLTRRALVTAALALLPLAAHAQGAQPPFGGPRPNGEESATIQATGRVTATPESNLFTLSVRNMLFRVSLNTRAALSRHEVRAGDRVRVSGELVASDRIIADSLEILERARPSRRDNVVIGTIRNIDRDERRIAVSTPDGNVRVSWDDDTLFIRNSTRSGPREFRPGDPVRIYGRRQEDRGFTARRVMFGGAPGWTSGAVGEIVAIDSRGRTAQVDFDGETWTVRLDTRALYRDGKRVDLDELRLGQDVRVTGTGRGAKTVDADRVEIIGRRPDLPERR